jgi:hypothetical protein
MKRNISAVLATTGLLLVSFLFSSCLKDTCRHTYKIMTPVYKKLTDLRAAVKSTAATTIVNTGKLYLKDNWIFLNEQNKGIHVIDNSNPAHPVKAAFINIPGNIDIAVTQNTLYADLYCDLAAIDITDPRHITVSSFLTNTFPDKSSNPTTGNPDSINVITDWASRDTTVSCDQNLISCGTCPNPVFYTANNSPAPSSSATSGKSGVAGSTARFATVGVYMYAVTTSNLNVIDLYEPSNPSLIQRKNIGWNIETIFPHNNKLYIGAGSSMSVYDLQNPIDPQQLSWSGHWCSGDPVVADDNYAYVTLHNENICHNTVNELEIYDLNSPGNPLSTYFLTSPQGLSKDGNLLFICDNGLKIYDASDVHGIKLIKQIDGIQTSDVIASNGIAYLVAKDGLYQYDYSDSKNIHLLSKLSK